MSIFSTAAEERSFDSLKDLLKLARSSGSTAAGTHVDEENAVAIPAVHNAIRLIAETSATISLFLYRRLPDGGKEPAKDHPLWRLVHDRPNNKQTSVVFRESLVANMMGWGNGFAKISFNNRGLPGRLPHIQAKNVRVFKDPTTKAKKFKVRKENGSAEVLPAGRMLHVPLWSYSGLVGFSPIQKMRRAVALQKAAEKYGAKFFEQDGTPGGYIKHPQKLDPETHERLKEDWNNAYTGAEGAHETAVLDQGMEFKPVSIPQEDAQFIQTRQYQVKEVARMFNIPPHLLKQLQNSNFATVSEMSSEFEKFTLRPILVRIEQELNRKLIPSNKKGELFFEHKLLGLLRADPEKRAEFYSTAIQNGWMTQNEVRDRENLNPVDGGDKLYIQKNMRVASSKGDGEVEQEPEEEAPEDQERAKEKADLIKRKDNQPVETRNAFKRSEIKKAFREEFEKAGLKIIRREVPDIQDLIDKHLPQGDINAFRRNLNEFLADHKEFVARTLEDPTSRLIERITPLLEEELRADPPLIEERDLDVDKAVFLNRFLEERAETHTDISRRKLLDILLDETLNREEKIEEMEKMLKGWDPKRAERIGNSESAEAEGAYTRQAMLQAGVSELMWKAPGENCPGCNALDGETVGIKSKFASKHDDVTGDGWHVGRDVLRPPLHRNPACECVLVRA